MEISFESIREIGHTNGRVPWTLLTTMGTPTTVQKTYACKSPCGKYTSPTLSPITMQGQAGARAEQRGTRDDETPAMLGPAGSARSITADEDEALCASKEVESRDTPGPLLPLPRQARERERERNASFHTCTRPDRFADEDGSPIDGAGAAGEDDGASAATATRPAACSRQLSQEAPASQAHSSAGSAPRDICNESSVECAPDSTSPTSRFPYMRDWGHSKSLYEALYEPGDDVLVERRARQMTLSERYSRRYQRKPQSFVGGDWPT